MKSLTRRSMGLLGLAALALVAADVGRVRADLISPADARGIRQLPGQNPFLLNFLSINHSVEDRTVLEFDLRGFSGGVQAATLNLDLRNLDPGGPAGVIDVYTFAGNGTVTPGLFGAGTFLTNFTNNASGLEQVDVTAAVQAALDAGEQFIGFRLSTTTSDRYLLGPPYTPSGPSLSVALVPEPASLALLGLGMLGLVGYGWRRWKRAAESGASLLK